MDFTSESPENPASQLNTVNPSTKGWQSARFCQYPQQLGFEILDGPVKINQIQILSHQSKISSKLEIFIGNGNSYDTADFKRLGYLSLDSNERSSYKARELKTVFVDHVGQYVKVLVNKNHVNKLNTYNQVGIIAVSLMGQVDDNADFEKKPNFSGGEDYKRMPEARYNHPYNDLSIDMNLDPSTARKLRELADAKSRAVDAEDYGTAKQIKIVEQELKGMGAKLAQLDMAKAEAVRTEDYDLAKDIKDECDALRGEIEQRIMNISIPGVHFSPPPKPVRAAPERQIPKFAPAKDDDGEDGFGAPSVAGPRSARGPPSPRQQPLHQQSPLQSKGAPLDVDSIPVGGGAGAAMGNRLFEQAQDDEYLEDRPIRPKATDDYRDPDPDSKYNEPAPAADMGDQFPNGEHPLEGVSNFMNLPVPEQVIKHSREFVEQTGLNALLGEYRVKCLFSKTWALREAAVLKVHLMLPQEFAQDIQGSLQGLCGVIRTGVEDKIQQVLFSTVSLMEDVLKETRRAKLSRSVVAPLFDPVIFQLIEKLADGNQRLREGAKKGLDVLASSSNIGPAVVGAHAWRPLTNVSKNAWRPLAARMQLMTDLVNAYGVGGTTGLNPDSLLNFPKTTGSFEHSNVEVRNAAKHLVVAIQKIIGTPPLESILSSLRPKQRDEYEAAFDTAAGHAHKANKGPVSSGYGAISKKAAPAHGADAKGGHDDDDQHHDHKANGHVAHGGKVPTSDHKAKGKRNDTSVDEGGDDFTTCMFCGAGDKKWNENDLDVHYWKDCPLLISCPSCAQIVEIAGLPEHLLDECESKSSYAPCDITGWYYYHKMTHKKIQAIHISEQRVL